MIPSALCGQLQQGLADFLRFSFWSSTPGMERVIDDLLDEPGSLLKGPYVSIKLPFLSGSNPRYFPHVPLGFTPHLHQEQAFERLGGEEKRSTLVATGTGSGKTESFLLPILDHCRAHAGQPGIKAILIYPMNALATDQAGRIARMVHGTPSLRGKVTAGLYIGESKGKKTVGETRMGPTSILTDRGTMQASPPDILLTNYKMLDYLLLRPGDQQIWQHNGRGVLRFLVVDEIHSFDGAQGTDLACLIRRLKRRLQVDDGALCCVGTSATLGGPSAGDQLRRYAGQVFGEVFDESAVIGEARAHVDAYLEDCPRAWNLEPGPDDLATLDPAHSSDPDAWLKDQVRLWFGELHEAESADAWAVELGDRLRQHATFRSLLEALEGRTVGLDTLVAKLARQRSDWRDHPRLGELSLLSMLGLVAAARSWRAELPEVAAKREKQKEPRPVQPFLDLRLQLWQRELRRMVGSVGARPRLRHSMDMDKETRRQHLPMIHCRECGALGWATLRQRDKAHLYRTDLDSFYRAFFGRDPMVEYLFPKAAVPPRDPSWSSTPFILDTTTLCRVEPGEPTEGPGIELVSPRSTQSGSNGIELSRDCPFCGAKDALTIVGFRAASLTSVYIDQLFASRFNDDKKLLTFSDSVQDAAHRAGFFGARTWRSHVRMAMLRVIREQEGLSLGLLADVMGTTWRLKLDDATWISTFIAPNMAWLHDWMHLQRTGEVADDTKLFQWINERLAYEVYTEFSMQARIGRSLPNTGTATVALDPERLEQAVQMLLEPLRNEVPGLQTLEADALRHFVLGLLFHLRHRGGILSGSLPPAYIESSGHFYGAFKKSLSLPGYGATSRLPVMLTDRSVGGRFETWSSRNDANWYKRWVNRSLGGTEVLDADASSAYQVVMSALVKVGLLGETNGRKGERIWGLNEHALLLSSAVVARTCERCGHRIHVAEREAEAWLGAPCLTARCEGRYGSDDAPVNDYFGRLYAAGDLQRIFTEEHTGLLDRKDRERVEREFKARQGPDDDPASRKPWYANLLSCTPTLEMGIDIGDLSAAVLCSIPPAQANYLQRVGRAGRRDGNAFILSVALGRPHDLYFYAQPEEMMEGEVSPPGVFLDAPAVLERQLAAFCFDRWVVTWGDKAVLPKRLGKVFSHLDQKGEEHFPFNLLAFVKKHQPSLLREFRELFGDELSAECLTHLQRFLEGTDDGKAGLRWKILETLRREKTQRDSLSNKARNLHTQIKRLEDQEAKPADVDRQLEDLQAEKEALLRLVRAINNRHILEFLTDEGLLPNYAFPESAVSLKSVIWTRKKKVPAKGSKYDISTYEYKRAPVSALSELAPGADFYAGGRRVRIDQVDVGAGKVELWRFCSACAYAQRVDTGDEAKVCPACGSDGWQDDGQRFEMLELQQVFSRTPDRESRIRDDKDERQPRFFQRSVLVHVDAQHRVGAWQLADDKLPFGFEYVSRATFRDVNFGEPSDQGAKSVINGSEAVRSGFAICEQCGKVQTPGRDPEHALSCPSRKEGAKPVIKDCLYLYREFSSEALRVLLPMADMGTTRQLHSFVAALQVGLKERFGGSVDHLRTTVYSDPVEDSTLRRQYLVIYDTVPGGTGYLAQLITPAAEGEEMPLFEAMRLALERIEACDCWNDPERDGCYRCLFGYRNAKDMGDTSATVASDLLRRILDLVDKDKLEQIESLGDISITGLMDSILEVRFIEALRLITDKQGRTAKLRTAVVNQKPGYRWTLGEAEWLVEPQVNPPPHETAGVPVSIDFVLRPSRGGSERKLAIFLDGWAYHKDRIGKDLRQRMALLASGGWDVWSFTWDDLDEKLASKDPRATLELAAVDARQTRVLMQQMRLASFADLPSKATFAWLEQELQSDGLPWERIAAAVLAARMSAASPSVASAWKPFVEKVAPPASHASLSAMAPRMAVRDASGISPFFELFAVHDGTGHTLLSTLDDREQHLDEPAFKEAWRGYLRLFQLLRHVPGAWFMTHKGSQEGAEYTGIAITRDGSPSDAGWEDMEDVEPAYRTLAHALAEAGVREPAVGDDIPDKHNGTWAEAELVWEELRVAVTERSCVEEARGEPAPGWTVLLLEDLDGDPKPIIEALNRSEES